MSANALGCICQAETSQGFENLWPEGIRMISHSAFLQNTNSGISLHAFVGNIITCGRNREFKTLQWVIALLKRYLFALKWSYKAKNLLHYWLQRALTIFLFSSFFNKSPLWHLVLTRSKSKLTKNTPTVPDNMVRSFWNMYELFLPALLWCSYWKGKNKVRNSLPFYFSFQNCSLSKIFWREINFPAHFLWQKNKIFLIHIFHRW